MAKLVQSQLKPRKIENAGQTSQGLSFPPNMHSSLGANTNKPPVSGIPQNMHSAMSPASIQSSNMNTSQSATLMSFPPSRPGLNTGMPLISHPPSNHTQTPGLNSNVQQATTQMPYNPSIQGPVINKSNISYPPNKTSTMAPLKSSNPLPPVPISALALAASATMINSQPAVGYPPIQQQTQQHQSFKQKYSLTGSPSMPPPSDQSYNGNDASSHHPNNSAGFDFDLL